MDFASYQQGVCHRQNGPIPAETLPCRGAHAPDRLIAVLQRTMNVRPASLIICFNTQYLAVGGDRIGRRSTKLPQSWVAKIPNLSAEI